MPEKSRDLRSGLYLQEIPQSCDYDVCVCHHLLQ